MRDWKFDHIDFSVFPYYGGNDLGVSYTPEKTTIKIWAPTAIEVDFRLYSTSRSTDPIRIEPLTKDALGCWSSEITSDLKGLYYTFQVLDHEWMNETPGPDARLVGMNGRRGLIFNPEETNPKGWENDRRVACQHPTDAIIYEVHVRDFSISSASGMLNKGKFLAFTEEGTLSPQGLKTGIDHLKELGVTHIHLLPVSDFFSVDESHPEKSYNWGYDPLNYNAPEGSYATNPDNPSRITEFKQLVMALHKAGIGVVLDVVYNHTGYTRRSWFNQTVPGYYYRQKSNGAFSNASGCGNELATERSMVRKYILDSLKYWAKEFHIDGFRFDLMGVYDLVTMNHIRQEMDRISPDILLYGEGWTADKSPLDERLRAVKHNVAKMNRIAVFNDDFRDAIKGNNFDGHGQGFVSGRTLDEERLKFGIVAACFHPQIVYAYVQSSPSPWASEPYQCVNYASCHDNYTLFDKLTISVPKSTAESIRKMVMLAGAIVLTSQGIPFIHAGEEFCRTKYGDHNSYKSDDSINQIDWERKASFKDVFSYYQNLIALRKIHPAFRMSSAEMIRGHLQFSSYYEPGVVAYSLINHANGDQWKTIFIVLNGNNTTMKVPVDPGKNWRIVASGQTIDLSAEKAFSGKDIWVEGISMLILAEV
jgi:pullulanase